MGVALIDSPWKMITIGHHRFQNFLAFPGHSIESERWQSNHIPQEAEQDGEMPHPLQRELTRDSSQQRDSLLFKRHRHGDGVLKLRLELGGIAAPGVCFFIRTRYIFFLSCVLKHHLQEGAS